MDCEDCEAGIGDSFNNATKKRCVYIWIVVALSLCAPLLVWAYAVDPPLGYTGAPGDFGTCAACHSAGSGGGNVKIAFSGGGTNYIPGIPQTLTITNNDPNSTTKAWGFEMTALEGSVATTPGTFAAASSNVNVAASGSKIYARHLNDSSNTFSVTWTPPASTVYNGSVVFYVASNAGTGVQRQADSVYTANYTLTLPNLIVTPSSLTFNYQFGGTTPPAQSVSVSSSGTGFGYSVTSSTNSGGNWLSATPASRTTPGSESVSVNPTGLAVGTYTGSVSVASTSAGNSPRTVAVTLNVTPPPNLTVTPGTLTFNYQIGGMTSPAQSVSVSSSGTALSYAVTSSTNSGGSWLSVTPASGMTPGSESVSVNPAGLAAGTYTGSVSVSSASAGNSPQTVAVTLHVRATAGDFDGDGKADHAVWRPSNGTWYVVPSSAPTTFTTTQWGVSGDIPVPGDYDGDGKTDMAVWRPSTGTWYILPSGKPGTFIAVQWGVSGDIPVPGDYDGDGKTDMAVWRPSNGTWYIIPTSAPTTFIATQWGVNLDIPVPGDYDGDGKTDMAVWRPSNGTWYIIPTSAPTTFIATQWGVSGDLPVPGDYDGDGKTDKAVWRPSNGTWYIIPTSAPTTFIATQWGVNADIPVPRDYDGDGKTDTAVWRPSNGTWYIIPSSAPMTFTATPWGISTDVPVQKPIGQ